MLTALLPGLRDFRTPLVTGWLYLLDAWLIFGEIVVDAGSKTVFGSRIGELSELVGMSLTLAAVSFGAYLLGSLLEVERGGIGWFRSDGRSIRSSLFDRADPAGIRLFVAESVQRSWPKGGLHLGDIDEDFSRMGDDFTQIARRAHRADSEGGDDEQFRLREAVEEAVLAGISNEYQTLVVRLQIERESIYSDYDRNLAEATLRFSIVPPLLVLVGIATLTGHPVAAALGIVPIVLWMKGRGKQRAADARVWQALTTGAVTSPTMELLQAALDAQPRRHTDGVRAQLG